MHVCVSDLFSSVIKASVFANAVRCVVSHTCVHIKKHLHTLTNTHTFSQGPGGWHLAECVFLRSSLKKMIQPNLPIPLAFHYLSHFLILLFHSSSHFAPWRSSPPLSHFYPWACSAISASLHLALSPPFRLRLSLCLCLHFTFAPYSCFSHFLSIRHRPRGEERGSGIGGHRVVMPHIVIAFDTMGGKTLHMSNCNSDSVFSWSFIFPLWAASLEQWPGGDLYNRVRVSKPTTSTVLVNVLALLWKRVVFFFALYIHVFTVI